MKPGQRRRAAPTPCFLIRLDSATRMRVAHESGCPVRLSCRTMASYGDAAAASAHYTRLRPWTFARRQRGTVRGTTRRIIPAQPVLSVRSPVPSVQLARVRPVSALLVNGRSAVRIHSPALHKGPSSRLDRSAVWTDSPETVGGSPDGVRPEIRRSPARPPRDYRDGPLGGLL